MMEFDDREAIRDAVQSLPAVQRFVVVKRMHGWSYQEIVAARGLLGELVSESAVKQAHCVACVKLRRRLRSRFE